MRLSVLSACLLAGIGARGSTATDKPRARGLQDKQLIVRVRLVDKPTTIKLDECQGDCDKDSDCLGDLVCFHRKNGEDVPGCIGNSRVNKRADFCAKSDDTQPPISKSISDDGYFNPLNIHFPNPPRDEWVVNPKEWEPHNMPIRMTSGAAAKLQLHWQPIAWWQEENFDRRWCMRCRKGCLPGHSLMIVHCDNIPGPQVQVPNLWLFEPVAGSSTNFRIKVEGQDACLSRVDKRTLRIDQCDPNSGAQRWVATAGSFTRGSAFQVRT